MSTPSTATITVPPNHQYYPHPPPQYLPPMHDYHHNASYQPGSSKTYSNGYANNTTPVDHRRPAAASTSSNSNNQRQAQPLPQPHSHHTAHSYEPTAPPSSNGSARKRAREDPVDWERYFGGRPPKEIIVIDDDEPSQPSHAPAAQPAAASNHGSYQTPSTTAASAHAAAPAPAAAASSSQYHTDKRRRVAGSTAAYDPVYDPHHHSYSNTQTPHYEPSPRTYAASSDRTTSYNTTTAPTSLSSNGTYVDPSTVGQKRKRSTRQAAADLKKREVATRPDPFSEYQPPPKPPLKAKEVYVPVVHDRVSSKDHKVDDEDGHYIVVENSELTERCTLLTHDSYLPIRSILANYVFQTLSYDCLAKALSARSSKHGIGNDMRRLLSRLSARYRSTETHRASS